MDNNFVDEVEDILENKYIKFQKLLHEQIYGLDCLYVNTFDEMIDLIRTTYAFKFQKKMFRNISIYKYWVENRFSDRDQLGFLERVHKILKDFDIPRSAIPEIFKNWKFINMENCRLIGHKDNISMRWLLKLIRWRFT